MFGSLGFDIYNYLTKCCGVEPGICRNNKEFQTLKVKLLAKSKKVDKMWIEGIYY